MALSSDQIERYSRQIIVPGFGGVSQERLLASHLALIAGDSDTRAVLPYLVGAGIGRITLISSESEKSNGARLIALARKLNPEVLLDVSIEIGEGVGLIFAIVGDVQSRETVIERYDRTLSRPMLLACVNSPAHLCFMPSHFARRDDATAVLLAPFVRRERNAGFVTMIAAADALNLLCSNSHQSDPFMLRFDDYTAHAIPFDGDEPGKTCMR